MLSWNRLGSLEDGVDRKKIVWKNKERKNKNDEAQVFQKGP